MKVKKLEKKIEEDGNLMKEQLKHFSNEAVDDPYKSMKKETTIVTKLKAKSFNRSGKKLLLNSSFTGKPEIKKSIVIDPARKNLSRRRIRKEYQNQGAENIEVTVFSPRYKSNMTLNTTTARNDQKLKEEP